MPHLLLVLLLSLLLPTPASPWYLEGFRLPAPKPPAVETPAPLSLPSASSAGSYTDPATGMEFVLVKGGCFQMGSNSGDSDEKPVHEVCVDDFYIGKYEVTQAQYQKVTGSNPSNFKGSDRPVEQVSWDDAQGFIRKLGGGKGYRLPTEAEWEYAARSGGQDETWAGTNSESSLGDYAWYDKNSGNQTHPVGQKRPNGLGLYDMSGNVSEWCADGYDKDYYAKSPRSNPQGPGRGSDRVIRDGGWNGSSGESRAANRIRVWPGLRGYVLGFRVAFTAEDRLVSEKRPVEEPLSKVNIQAISLSKDSLAAGEKGALNVTYEIGSPNLEKIYTIEQNVYVFRKGEQIFKSKTLKKRSPGSYHDIFPITVPKGTDKGHYTVWCEFFIDSHGAFKKTSLRVN